MSKREKKSFSADKIESTENKVSISSGGKKVQENFSDKKNSNADFINELKQSAEGLWYMSETDAEITVITGKKADSVTKAVLIEQFDISPETNIEEKSSADFFSNLTELQNWYGEEEQETAKKFSTLEKLLEENLQDLKVFKVGQIEIDIYVIGLDSQNILTGIFTKAVET